MMFKNIPDEVLWVMILPKMVGSDTYDEAERIIAEYSKWFPWETKYKSIPKEVHAAYRKEKYPDIDKPIVCGEGLIAQMKKSEVKSYNDYSKKSLKEVWEDFIKLYEQSVKEEKIRFNKEKALWDKYYKDYKLEYRE